MPQPNRIKLSLAGTAAVALVSLPLGVTPASAAKVTEGTTSSIGVIEASSKASRFNWNLQNRQSLAYMADQEGRGRGRGGRGNSGVVLTWLQQLLRDLGIVLPSQFADGGFGDVGMQ